jgi:hypothetical protein
MHVTGRVIMMSAPGIIALLQEISSLYVSESASTTGAVRMQGYSALHRLKMTIRD